MAITSTTTLTVADQTPTTGAAQVVILPPSSTPGFGTGRLVHPTLGTLDYPVPPEETEDVDGGPVYRPVWSRARTLGGTADALWSGYLRDAEVLERWQNGDVGMPLPFFRMLWLMFTNPPDPAAGSFVLWSPTYAGTALSWKVAISSLSAGGDRYGMDWLLAKKGVGGFVPGPVELEMRVLGLAT